MRILLDVVTKLMSDFVNVSVQEQLCALSKQPFQILCPEIINMQYCKRNYRIPSLSVKTSAEVS